MNMINKYSWIGIFVIIMCLFVLIIFYNCFGWILSFSQSTTYREFYSPDKKHCVTLVLDSINFLLNSESRIYLIDGPYNANNNHIENSIKFAQDNAVCLKWVDNNNLLIVSDFDPLKNNLLSPAYHIKMIIGIDRIEEKYKNGDFVMRYSLYE